MVWTFGKMALHRAEMADFLAEFVSFTVCIGFQWWLLVHAGDIGEAIIESFLLLGSKAAALQSVSPDDLVMVAFSFIKKTALLLVSNLDSNFKEFANTFSLFNPGGGLEKLGPLFLQLAMDVLSLVLSIVLAIRTIAMTANIIIINITSWIVAYAGIFFLGFGGSRWASDMAIGYYKAVLGTGARLMTIVLIIGIAKLFVDILVQMPPDLLKQAQLVTAVFILMLVAEKTPDLVAHIVDSMGGGQGGTASPSQAVAMAAALTMNAPQALASRAKSALAKSPPTPGNLPK